MCFECRKINNANNYVCPFCKSTSNVPIGYESIDTKEFKLCKFCKKLNQAKRETCKFCGKAPLYKITLPKVNSDILIFQEGIKALKKNKYTDAFQSFNAAYEYYEFPWSLLAIAECYRLGYGTEKDAKKALEYLKKSKLPEIKKKYILYKSEIRKAEQSSVRNRKESTHSKVKATEQLKKEVNPIESKMAFSIPIDFHPIRNENILVQQTYFSLLYDIFSELKFDSPYIRAMFEYYRNIFHLKSRLTNIRCKISNEIKFYIYYDFMIISGYDKKFLSERTLEKIKKITGVYYDSSLKSIYTFSIDANIEWQKIISEEKNRKKKKWLSCIKENYSYAKQKPFRILITATMSAGKSTLINAIVGKKIAKVQNEACTGRIHCIYNKPFEDNLIGKWEKSKNPIIDGVSTVLSDNEADTDLLSYEAAYFQNAIPNTRLLLLDTPGINSAEHKNHGEITKQAIAKQQYDLMLYVINYTVESTDDNDRYLHEIKETLNPDTPVIFLLNKIDHYGCDDAPLTDKLQQITNDLKKIGYHNPIVFPFSASSAFYAQILAKKYNLDFNNPDSIMKLCANATDMNHFTTINALIQNKKLHLERYYSLPQKEKAIIYQKLSDAKAKNDLFEQAIVHSGLSSLMSAIYIFVSAQKEHIFIQREQENTFPIYVISDTSSGKSTLINAFLRKKLMTPKNEACTAIITEILDNDRPGYTATVYNRNYEQVNFIRNLTYEDMNNLNDNEEIARVSIEGNIPFLNRTETRLKLVDTPSLNNCHRNANYLEIIYRIVNKASKNIIIYILDYTQLATNDDGNLLNYVAEEIRKGGKKTRDKFLFVINKMDAVGEDDSIPHAIEITRKYLAKHGIEEPQIFPCSAFTALGLRSTKTDFNKVMKDPMLMMQLMAKPNEQKLFAMMTQLNNTEDLHLEKYSTLTPSEQANLRKKLDEAIESNDYVEQALIHSGIYSIESAIRAYVQKYANS